MVAAPRSGLLGCCQRRAGGRLMMGALKCFGGALGSCLRRNDGGGEGMNWGGGVGVVWG